MADGDTDDAGEGGGASAAAAAAGLAAVTAAKAAAEAKKKGPNKAAEMVQWTGRLAFFLGFCAFVVMFLLSYDFHDYMAGKMIAMAVVKASCAALLFWLAGLIIGNIFLKGLITDIPVDQQHLIDGGILQRIYLYQQRLNYDMDGNVIQIDPRNDSIIKNKTAKVKKE